MVRTKYLSIIIPVYNEEENVPLLHERLRRVMEQQHFSYEIIYIDDGSKDGTPMQLERVAQSDKHVQVIRFRRNFGQTAAMAAGIEQSLGEIIVFMDGDLQNDPIDIPHMLAKMEEGYDVVSGWRKDRQDAQISRKIPSRIANWLISKITGVQLHDYGCTLKAYRYEVLRNVQLYGEMHRFIPAYVSLSGAAMVEMPVTHHARQFGKSKYNLSRVVRVLLDLTTVKFLGSFGTKPLYPFGIVGLTAGSIGAALPIWRFARRRIFPQSRVQSSSTASTSLQLIGFGGLSIMIGLVAEMLMRTYHEAQGKATYVVQRMLPTVPPPSLFEEYSPSRSDEQTVIK